MPEYDDDPPPRRSADDLRRLARYQRWIVAVVLAQVGLWIGYLVLALARDEPIAGPPRFTIILTVILGCAGGIFAFLIYCTVRNPVSGLMMAAACIPPLLGLLALVVVNSTATRELEANGVPVGMFGADPDIIEDIPGLYDEDEGW